MDAARNMFGGLMACGRKRTTPAVDQNPFRSFASQSLVDATRTKWMALYSVKGVISLTASFSSLLILGVFVRKVPYIRIHFPGVDHLDDTAFNTRLYFVAAHLGIDIFRWGLYFVVMQRGPRWCKCLKWGKASRALDLAMKGDGRLQWSFGVIAAHALSDPIFVGMSFQFVQNTGEAGGGIRGGVSGVT